MIRFFFTPCALATTLAAVLFGGHCALAQEVRLPVPPRALLQALPAPPPEWKLIASNAKHIPKARPLSKAEREYHFAPPPGVPGTPPPSTSTVTITLVDTAADPQIAGYLTGGETAGNAKRLSVGALPALRTEQPGASDHLEALALQRFVIKITITGDTKEKAENWLGRINLQELRSAAAQTSSFDSQKEFILVAETFDELNPKRRSTSKWTLGAEIAEPENPSPNP